MAGASGTAEGGPEERSGHSWSILPTFDPSVDDPKEYSDKIRFLHSICPPKDKPMLAPRLALLMKGTAWAQVKNLDGSKLSDPDGGVKLLLSAVSSWEESAELQTYEKFERALYRVVQKPDESVFSYVNRMNVAFNEIANVTLQEVQAFIMLRQSVLNGEDKKRVLSMTGGELKAKKVEASMRQLAPKILVGNAGNEGKKKVYPVNLMEEEDDINAPTFVTEEDYVPDEEAVLQALIENGDEDALMVSEFEDQLIEACQDNVDLSMCFSAYTEARGRIRDKIRARGFWPPIKGKGKKGAKKGTWPSKGGLKKRQSLADRIANSHCRLCGARGHWRQECPNKGSVSGPNANAAEIHVSTQDGMNTDPENQEIFERLPISLEQGLPNWWPMTNSRMTIQEMENEMCQNTTPGEDVLSDMMNSQVGEESPPSQSFGDSNSETRVNEEFIYAALTLDQVKQKLSRGLRGHVFEKRLRCDSPFEPVFFVDHGSVAILDTGASKSVIGKKRLEQLMHSLPDEFRNKIFWQKSETVFRFGNNGTLSSLGAVFLPFGSQWLKIEVVDGTTPFLLSNAFLKAVTADICTSKRLLSMFQGKVSVPLGVSDKGLFLVDLTEILKHAQQNLMHGNPWEVVTNLIDERTVTREEKKETPLDTFTAPAATQASSTVKSTSRSTKPHGAQEGEPSLCGHIQCGHATSIPGRPHVESDAGARRDQHREATGYTDPQAMGRRSPDRR